jgi:hypothetical protein
MGSKKSHARRYEIISENEDVNANGNVAATGKKFKIAMNSPSISTMKIANVIRISVFYCERRAIERSRVRPKL